MEHVDLTPYDGGHDDDTPDYWGTPEECAARGLAWLREDGHRFGLDVNRIDPKALMMGSMNHCALAQAGRDDFGVLVRRVTGASWLDDSAIAWSMAHGFMVGSGSMDQLQLAWRKLLAPATVE